MAAVETLVTVKQHGFVVKEQEQQQHAFSASLAVLRSAAPAESGAAAGGGCGDAGAAVSSLLAANIAPVPPAPLLSTSAGLPRSGDLRPAEHAHLTPGVKRMMKSVVRGLKAHQEPEAATEGLGGTYFFCDELGSKIAIMKPCDEEPLAPNNPKGFVGRQLGEPGLKPTVRVGEAATREVAAYLLDHERFARVPHTVMVNMSHPAFHVAGGGDPASPPAKLGSLQEFVPHQCDTSEMGASGFRLRDVHRIGILDIRLFNTDRHAGNILIRRLPPPSAGDAAPPSAAARDLGLGAKYELIPIDHGFALPEALEPPYFEWQHWPQAMMPFGREELEYVSNLDPRADADMLRRELPALRPESLRLLEVSTTLLQKCAAAGLSLAEIAAVVSRPLIGLDEEASELEKICFAARMEVDEADEALTDLEEEEEGEEEEGEEQYGEEEGQGMLLAEADTPTSSDASASEAATRFNGASSIPLSDVTSRLDDGGLFHMDEDAGGRTPPVGSPRGSAPRRGAAVGRPCATEPPRGAADWLPASFDSMSLGRNFSPDAAPPVGHGAVSETSSMASGFAASASYMPGCAAKSQPRPAKARRRRPMDASRLRKRSAQAYPPLVESRNPLAAGVRVFSGLSDEQWDHFMHSVRTQICAALRSGAWRQVSPGKGQPLMSCPRF